MKKCCKSVFIASYKHGKFLVDILFDEIAINIVSICLFKAKILNTVNYFDIIRNNSIKCTKQDSAQI